MHLISVVIPVYNSEKTIELVVNRVISTFEANGLLFEIILVNDGSKDGSADVCRNLAERKGILFLNFTKNFGQHQSLLAGFKRAKGDVIVKIDDDLQIIPEQIPKLVEHLIETDSDVVFAKYNNKKHSAFRNWGSKLNNFMALVLINKPKHLVISNFYAMKDYVAKSIVTYENPYPYIAGLIFQVTDKILNIELEHADRQNGKSNYTLKKLIKLWANGFVNFSVRPLRVSAALGAILSVFGFIFMVYLIIQRMFDDTVQLGWTSIMAALIFFGGIQLMSIGLLGEYIGRIFISINGFPQYVIKETKNGEE